MELIGQTQCSSEIYQASDIENAVFQALKKELSLLDSLYSDIKKEEQSLKEASRKASRRKTLMEQELKNLKGEKMRMYEEYAAGTLSLDNYKSKKLEYRVSATTNEGSHKPQTAPRRIRGCVCSLCGLFYFVILIRMDVKFQS